jgi:cyclic pyranopterin phosphate synthase
MVDVGGKSETPREAKASALVRMSGATLSLIAEGQAGARGNKPGKGDVLAVARIAALQGMKQTAALIPLCHPVRVVGSEVELRLDPSLPGVRILVTARAFDRTGVEMEAMVGASVAALTVYDMVKGNERGVEIASVRLEEKRGGKSGVWLRSDQEEPSALSGPHGVPPRPTLTPRTTARRRRPGRV